MSKYCVYILRSRETGKYYTGQTNNLRDRLLRHNGGRVRSTKAGRPWDLVVYYQCTSREEAMRLEKRIKSLKNRRSIEEYFEVNPGEYEA